MRGAFPGPSAPSSGHGRLVKRVKRLLTVDRLSSTNPARRGGESRQGCERLFLSSCGAWARVRGDRPGRFSFNGKGGRCEACEGDGVLCRLPPGGSRLRGGRRALNGGGGWASLTRRRPGRSGILPKMRRWSRFPAGRIRRRRTPRRSRPSPRPRRRTTRSPSPTWTPSWSPPKPRSPRLWPRSLLAPPRGKSPSTPSTLSSHVRSRPRGARRLPPRRRRPPPLALHRPRPPAPNPSRGLPLPRSHPLPLRRPGRLRPRPARPPPHRRRPPLRPAQPRCPSRSSPPLLPTWCWRRRRLRRPAHRHSPLPSLRPFRHLLRPFRRRPRLPGRSRRPLP